MSDQLLGIVIGAGAAILAGLIAGQAVMVVQRRDAAAADRHRFGQERRAVYLDVLIAADAVALRMFAQEQDGEPFDWDPLGRALAAVSLIGSIEVLSAADLLGGALQGPRAHAAELGPALTAEEQAAHEAELSQGPIYAEFDAVRWLFINAARVDLGTAPLSSVLTAKNR